MQIDWNRAEVKLAKKQSVASAARSIMTSEQKERHWQQHLDSVKASNEFLAKYPRFSAHEDGIDLRVSRCESKAEEWHWWVHYRACAQGHLMDVSGSAAGNTGSESSAKAEAIKAYLRLKEVKEAAVALRERFHARWGAPEKK